MSYRLVVASFVPWFAAAKFTFFATKCIFLQLQIRSHFIIFVVTLQLHITWDFDIDVAILQLQKKQTVLLWSCKQAWSNFGQKTRCSRKRGHFFQRKNKFWKIGKKVKNILRQQTCQIISTKSEILHLGELGHGYFGYFLQPQNDLILFLLKNIVSSK